MQIILMICTSYYQEQIMELDWLKVNNASIEAASCREMFQLIV